MKILLAVLLLAAVACAQTPPPVPPSQSPLVRAIRFKLSAADLDSAESLLEQHKAEAGADPVYILGASWIARGAALLQNWSAAERYSALTRKLCGDTADPDLLYALGSAIEVHAQVLDARGHKEEAVAWLDERLQQYAGAPLGFRSRLYKRSDMIGLVGRPAPLALTEKGKPAILFLWAHYCGDCLGQEPALARFWQKYRDRGIQLAAVTRIYDSPADKDKIDEVWRSSYKELAGVPVIVSTDAMLRYGGSSTPTFVFIDAAGIVRAYLPYRLTEERLAEEAEKLFTKK